MQYFVIWTDGQKYGPATVDVLNEWIGQGRVTPDTVLETLDGQKVNARDLSDLIFAGHTSDLTDTPATPAPQPMVTPAPVASVTPMASAPKQYFVMGPNGSKYGPADVPTLNQWAAQSRLTPTTQLQDAETGQTVMASAVAGITFMGAATGMGVSTYEPRPTTPAPTAYSYAPQYGGQVGGTQEGKNDFTMSLVFGIAGFFCCPVIFSGIGLFFGIRANKVGYPGAIAGIVVSAIGLVLGFIGICIWIFAFAAAATQAPTTHI